MLFLEHFVEAAAQILAKLLVGAGAGIGLAHD